MRALLPRALLAEKGINAFGVFLGLKHKLTDDTVIYCGLNGLYAVEMASIVTVAFTPLEGTAARLMHERSDADEFLVLGTPGSGLCPAGMEVLLGRAQLYCGNRPQPVDLLPSAADSFS